MEHQKVPTFSLKVNVNCCATCQLKAKDKLQKIRGVESVVYDSKGVVTVSGKVNPMVIIHKFEKWGKSAELLSFQESAKQGTPKKGNDNDVDPNGSHPKSGKESCSVMSDSISEDQKDVCKAHAAAAQDSNDATTNISWKNPHLQTVNMESTKSGGTKSFLGFIWKKKKKKKKVDREKTKGAPLTNNGPSKWQYPRVPGPPYDASMPYQQQPLGPCPPPVMARPPVPPYQPFGFMQPMPPYPPVAPPPYGVFNSRPPPKVNPMVHYTSYADNYRFW